MRGVGAGVGKSLAAVFAPEWLVSSMDPHVFLKKIFRSSRGSKSSFLRVSFNFGDSEAFANFAYGF